MNYRTKKVTKLERQGRLVTAFVIMVAAMTAMRVFLLFFPLQMSVNAHWILSFFFGCFVSLAWFAMDYYFNRHWVTKQVPPEYAQLFSEIEEKISQNEDSQKD